MKRDVRQIVPGGLRRLAKPLIWQNVISILFPNILRQNLESLLRICEFITQVKKKQN